MQLGTLWRRRPATYRLAVSEQLDASRPMPLSPGWSPENSAAPGTRSEACRTRQGTPPAGLRVWRWRARLPTEAHYLNYGLDAPSLKRANPTRWTENRRRALRRSCSPGVLPHRRPRYRVPVWAPTLRALSAAEPTVIAPEGELDITRVGDFRAALWDAAREGAAAVVVDLSHVSFIDSSGLGALVELHSRLRRRGRRLAVVTPGGSAPAVSLGSRRPARPPADIRNAAEPHLTRSAAGANRAAAGFGHRGGSRYEAEEGPACPGQAGGVELPGEAERTPLWSATAG